MPEPDALTADLPDQFTVSVLMARHPVSNNRWIDHRWESMGVVCRSDPRGPKVMERDGVREVLYGGFPLSLHADECESYYHNLRAQQPACFVITRAADEGDPVPFLVSLSFDEANAYLETDGVEVFAVSIPPELYRWTEAYVLARYVPEPRRKRKRTDWRKTGR